MLVPNPAMLETSAIDDRIAEAKPICEAGYNLLVTHQNMNPIKLEIKLIPKIKKALAKSGCLILMKVFLRNLVFELVLYLTDFIK